MIQQIRCICQSLDTSLKAIHNAVEIRSEDSLDVYANL